MPGLITLGLIKLGLATLVLRTSGLIAVALVVTSLTACSAPEPDQGAISNNSGPSADARSASPVEGLGSWTELSFAESFRFTQHPGHTVVQVRNDPDADWRETIVLVPRGAAAPVLEGDLADAVVIETPVRSIATNAVSDLSRLRVLGLADRVVGIATAAVYDEEIFQRFERGEITLMGHPGHGQPNLEALLAAGPDLTLILSTGPDHAQGLQRIRDLGLAAVPTYAFSEKTVLGRAEWIIFVALFFGAEDEARAYFDEVATSYLSLSERAKAAAGASPPVAFWGGPVGGNRWWAERNGPEATLLEDAGALNPLADPTAGPFATLDTASMLSSAAEADLWLTSALDESAWDRRSPVDLFAAYRAGQVFHNRKRVNLERDAWDWNETAISRPDLALADVVSLLHPGLLPDHELYFFDKVALGSE